MSKLSLYEKGFEPDVARMGSVLLTSVEDGVTKTGKPFIKTVLQNIGQKVKANAFDMTVDKLKEMGIECPSVVNVRIKMTTNNGNVYYNIEKIEPDKSGLQISDFINCVSETDKHFDNILNTVNRSEKVIGDGFDSLSRLTLSILGENKEKFIISAAGVTMHHDLRGGLVLHTEKMVEAADALCNVYDLDRELLVCGAALHDIGKTEELDTSVLGDCAYTVDGRLLGHAILGIQIINKAAARFNCDPERLELLKHMIASHHGKLEYGAAAMPAIPEATFLHEIDMMDSRYYMYSNTYTGMRDSTLSAKKIFGLDNVTVYKMRQVKEDDEDLEIPDYFDGFGDDFPFE